MPVYFCRDTEIFKRIATKDFESFEDHKFVIEPDWDTLMGNNLFMFQGQHWREMRAILSPAFTGNKMKLMFGLIREVAADSIDYLLKEAHIKGPQTFEMRDFFTRYANDVIASCAFGLKINSFADRDNKFYRTGRKLDDLGTPKSYLRLLLKRIMPRLTKAIGFEFLEADFREFFSNVILENMRDRKAMGIHRPDMIDLLMRARDRANTLNSSSELANGKEIRSWSDAELVGQCFVFFLAGFDTVTWVLTHAAFSLATNPTVQVKLCDEIDHFNRLVKDREVTCDDLKQMKYLDAIVSEVLRLGPATSYIDRMCTKDYYIEELGTTIEKGANIWFPLYNFQRDAKVFEDPTRFEPERFTEANRKNINHDYYMPFGIGPRACIGNRFALMEVKAVLYFLLSHFTFEVTPKTKIPLRTRSSPFGMKAANDTFLELRPRSMSL